jgi:hypothetical protein
VASEARIVTALPDSQAHAAMLRRLVVRHKADKLQDPLGLKDSLLAWAKGLEGCMAKKEADEGGLAELGHWLVLARFVAQEGSE